MKYILIANNKHILDEEIEKLVINKDDVIILFNHQYPLKWTKIKNHPNKILIIRMMTWGFLGAQQTKSNHGLYKKIIPYSKNNFPLPVIKSYFQKKISNTVTHKLDFINPIMHQLLNDILKYPSNKDPTLGYIGYNYVKHMIGENIDIVLVGFTLIYDGKLGTGNGHAWQHEIDFYTNELNTNKRLTKIDAVPQKYLTPFLPNDNEHENKNTREKNKIALKNKNKKHVRPTINGPFIETDTSKTPVKKPVNLNIKPQLKNLLKLHFQRTRTLRK